MAGLVKYINLEKLYLFGKDYCLALNLPTRTKNILYIIYLALYLLDSVGYQSFIFYIII